jgi:hypothetical protein
MIVNNLNGNATSQYYRGSKEHNTAANAGFEAKFDTGAIKHTLGLRTDYLTRKYSQHKSATSSGLRPIYMIHQIQEQCQQLTQKLFLMVIMSM